MKTKGKAWQLVVTVLLIAAFVYTAFFGVAVKYGDVTKTYIKGAQDIRFGVDIKGGVNVTFAPSDNYDATDDQLDAAQLVIENRLVGLNVTDYELYVDYDSDRLILEFPWQSGETDFDPEAAIEEIGSTAYLTFRKGSSADGELILDGSMVESAAAQYGPVSGSTSEYYVALKFNDEGAKAFGDATTELYQSSGTISIWLDDQNVSTATVNAAITDGAAIITSSASNPFTQEDVVKMARQINSGALPFALTVDSYSTVSPSLGENSLSAMVLAGLIAYALIVVLMTLLYRLPGFLACIALAGQVAATLAFVSGYFPVFESFTLTLPGIAGIILAIGMGVDANVITAERIKEELNNGKSLDGALKSGFARGLTPIIDGNVTIVIVAIVLMGAFGPSDGLFAKALHFVFFAFGPSTAGTIYAFGYTLLTGVLLNFVFGVFATRVMIRGAASIKALRNPWLYGAVKPGKEVKEKKPIDFVGLRKRFLTISTCLMAAIILCAAVFGVRLDTEFTGGAMITLSYQGEISTSEVQKTASTALETMAGKGSEIGKRFEELAAIYDGVRFPDRLRVCFDTCHVHDAGYDLTANPDLVLDEFDKTLGKDQIAVFHINDSKNEKGAAKDRHANLGVGQIGFAPLYHIVHHPDFLTIPKILETPWYPDPQNPKKLLPPYRREIAWLRAGRIDA